MSYAFAGSPSFTEQDETAPEGRPPGRDDTSHLFPPNPSKHTSSPKPLKTIYQKPPQIILNSVILTYLWLQPRVTALELLR